MNRKSSRAIEPIEKMGARYIEYPGELKRKHQIAVDCSSDIKFLRSLPYEDYLKTEYWQKTRQEMLHYAEYRCMLCYSDCKLHIHHRVYERIGCERKTDLIVLCDKCHRKFHDKTGINDKLIPSIAKSIKLLFDELVVAGFTADQAMQIVSNSLPVLGRI